MFVIWSCLIVGCTQEKEETTNLESPLGVWFGLEKDGMLFPIILEGEIAQNEFDDAELQRSVQTVRLDLYDDGTGTLTSTFVMTNIDESTYDFSYSVPMNIDISKEPYLLQAYDAEIDEELNLECYQTEAGFLNCTYTSNIESGTGTLNFIREEV